MGKKILLIVAGIALSAVASTALGNLAIRLTDFHSAVGGTPARIGGNPFGATLHMIRITAFVLDPLVAILVGAIIGLWCDDRPSLLAAIAILPLAAFAAYSYPWLRPGIVAGLIDILAATAAAEATYRMKPRGPSYTRRVGE